MFNIDIFPPVLEKKNLFSLSSKWNETLCTSPQTGETVAGFRRRGFSFLRRDCVLHIHLEIHIKNGFTAVKFCVWS